MSFYDSADAIYGVGVYGQASYGIVTPVIQVTGVSATGSSGQVQEAVSELLETPAAITSTIGVVKPNVAEPIGSVSATGEITAPEVNIALVASSVFATGAVNTLEQVALVEKPAGVSASGAIEVPGVGITERPSGVSGTGAVAPVVAGGFEIDITEKISVGVEGTGQVAGVQANPGAGVTGVSVTGSIGSVDHSNTTLLQSVVGTAEEPTIGVGALDTPTGVSATGVVNGNLTHSNSTLLSAVVASGQSGQTTETGVLFNFRAVRDKYDRRRTIRIGRAA